EAHGEGDGGGGRECRRPEFITPVADAPGSPGFSMRGTASRHGLFVVLVARGLLDGFAILLERLLRGLAEIVDGAEGGDDDEREHRQVLHRGRPAAPARPDRPRRRQARGWLGPAVQRYPQHAKEHWRVSHGTLWRDQADVRRALSSSSGSWGLSTGTPRRCSASSMLLKSSRSSVRESLSRSLMGRTASPAARSRPVW